MSFPRYETYKDSGVEWLGEVPAHWRVVRLGNLYGERVEAGSDGLPILSVSIHDGVSDDELDPDELERKVTRSEDKTKYKAVKRGDLVYNMMRAWQGGFGSVEVPGMVSPAYVVAQPRRDDFFSRFVEQVLRSPNAVEEMRRHSRGVTDFRLRLYWEEFKDIRIALPPREEQAEILAAIRNEAAKIDALVGEQQRLIALLEEKRQAVISHAVTKGLEPNARMKDSDVGSLGDVPAHWEVKRIKYLVRSIEQGWSPQCDGFSVDSLQEWGVLKVGCVNGGVFDPRENKSLPTDLDPIPALAILTGDLLISRANTRELVGSAAVAREDYPNLMLCDKLYRLRLHADICISEFLTYFLGTNAARGQIEVSATGASNSMLNIGQSAILEMAAPIPPVSEQKTIVNSLRRDVARYGSLTAETQSAIAILQERRSALVSAAVTGKIDVRGLVADREAA
jgi:type I restriction enzyme S subunit